jgi:hypothetical protein
VPDEGILSGSPRLRLVLKVLARFSQIWRVAFLIESDLQFLMPHWILPIFASAPAHSYHDTSAGVATLRKGYWFWQSSGIL